MKQVLLILDEFENTDDITNLVPIWTGHEDQMVDIVKRHLKANPGIKGGVFAVYEVAEDGHVSRESTMILITQELLEEVGRTLVA